MPYIPTSFYRAGSGLSGPGYSRSDHKYAFFATRSGLPAGRSVSDHELAYLGPKLGVYGSIDDLEALYSSSPLTAFRTNLAAQPNIGGQFFQYGDTGTTATLSQQTGAFGGATRFTRYSFTANGTSPHFYAGNNKNTVSPGKPYSVRAGVRATWAAKVFLQVEWYGAADNYVDYVMGALVTLTAGQVTQLALPNITPPAGTAYANIEIIIDTTSTAPVVGTDTLDYGQILVEASTSAGTYFDGTTAGCSWSGTAEASTSSGYPGVA